MELFEKIIPNTNVVNYEDIWLLPGNSPPYALSENVLKKQDLTEVMEASDLKDILEKLSEAASKRFIHLEKHPEKTEAKIRV
jgi:hypothetical protein